MTLYNIDLDVLQNMKQLFVKAGNNWNSLTIRNIQGYDDYAIIHFKEITDRTGAEALREEYLYLDENQFPELGEDEYFLEDLLGCEVLDEKGTTLGEVTDILSPGAHEVLVVEGSEGESMFPVVEEWIIRIDVPESKIHVRSIEEIS